MQIKLNISMSVPGCSSSTLPSFDLKLVYQNIVKKRSAVCCDPRNKEDKKAESKFVLCNVDGYFEVGLNAIIGPSGCGKTSLLKILRPNHTSLVCQRVGYYCSTVTQSESFPSFAYIDQHEVDSILSVGEMLWFSANLRLPQNLSKKQKSDRINENFAKLSLAGNKNLCADSKTEWRSLSGGEKRLLSVAIEVLANPDILLLDEPASGLDASSAMKLVLSLKEYGKTGKIIVLSIHQPGYSLFKLFDSLTILNEGQCVYQGPADQSVEYFKDLGFDFDNDPSSYIHEILEIASEPVSQKNTSVSEAHITTTNLVETFKSTEYYETFCNIADDLPIKWRLPGTGHDCKTSFLTQMKWLTFYSFKHNLCHPRVHIRAIIASLVIAVLFGGLYFQMGVDLKTGIRNRFGIIFFVCSNMLFGSVNSLHIFLRAMEPFKQQYMSLYYSCLPYFICKTLFDVFLPKSFSVFCFASVIYWMSGLQPTLEHFMVFYGTLLLTAVAICSVAILISQFATSADMAGMLLTIVILHSIMFAGLLVNLNTMVMWWVQYISIAKYSFASLCVNEFKDLSLQHCVDTSTNITIDHFVGKYLNESIEISNKTALCFKIPGRAVLRKDLAMDITKTGDIEPYQMMNCHAPLLIITVSVLLLAFVKFRHNARKFMA